MLVSFAPPSKKPTVVYGSSLSMPSGSSWRGGSGCWEEYIGMGLTGRRMIMR